MRHEPAGGGAQLDAHHASGESALGLAAARGHRGVVTQLLRAGASPAAQADDHGWTPMHAALVHGEADVAVQLLERGRIRTPRDLRDAGLERSQWVERSTSRTRPSAPRSSRPTRTARHESDRGARLGRRWRVGRRAAGGRGARLRWRRFVRAPSRGPLLMPDRPGVPETYLPDAAHTREDIGRRSGYLVHGRPAALRRASAISM